MRPLVISFSGGKTSGMMAKLLVDKYKGLRKIITVFANTGKEREETLIFVDQCDREFGLNVVWIETLVVAGRKSSGFKIVDFKTADRSGKPFEDVIGKYGIPNAAFPHCTRELKTNPITNYVKSIGLTDYEMALGIRIDEPKRLTAKEKISYPLANEFPTTKPMVNRFWNGQSFNLELKPHEGNCDLCWKKSKRKLLTIIKDNPELVKWWDEMEQKFGSSYPASQSKGRKPPETFFRDRTSALELVEDSKEMFDKETVVRDLFRDMEMDYENGECSESCEPF